MTILNTSGIPSADLAGLEDHFAGMALNPHVTPWVGGFFVTLAATMAQDLIARRDGAKTATAPVLGLSEFSTAELVALVRPFARWADDPTTPPVDARLDAAVYIALGQELSQRRMDLHRMEQQFGHSGRLIPDGEDGGEPPTPEEAGLALDWTCSWW